MSRRSRAPGTRGRRRPATIVDWFEANKPSGRPVVLSEPSKTWVDRVWHAYLRGEGSEHDANALWGRYEAYVDGLADQEEARLTATCVIGLLDMADGPGWPRCADCGRVLCPHCDMHSHEEEA
jgi:hypothetical protein